MKTIFLIISCLACTEFYYRIKLFSNLVELFSLIKKYLNNFKINEGKRFNDSFQIFKKILLLYLILLIKLLIIILPIILNLFIGIYIDESYINFLVNIKTNMMIIFSMIIYLIIRKKIV